MSLRAGGQSKRQSLLPVFTRIYGSYCDAFVFVTVFSGSGERPDTVGWFKSINPQKRRGCEDGGSRRTVNPDLERGAVGSNPSLYT